MKVDRIVERGKLKARLKALEQRFQESMVLVAAENKLRQAYYAGYKKRLFEEQEELAAQQSVNPRNDAEDSGSPQTN